MAAFSYEKSTPADPTRYPKLKDPGSAITHFIGVAGAVAGGIPLLILAGVRGGAKTFTAELLFVMGLFLLYGASTTYHSLDLDERRNKILRKLDHAMIYVLIAGTYSPICMLVLEKPVGTILLAVIWGMALLGFFQALFWIGCPKWVSSMIYVAMGWVCVAVFPALLKDMPKAAMIWLFAGGVIYTVGAVIYAMKLKIFNLRHKNFGSHEVFHLFCLGGSLCHYIMMYYLF